MWRIKSLAAKEDTLIEEEIKKLLDDYYGDTRTDVQKEDIAEFVKDYSPELTIIFAANKFV
jgi:hypothetical protein